MPVPGFFIKNVRIGINEKYQLSNSPVSLNVNLEKSKSEPAEADVLDMYIQREDLENKFLEFLKISTGSYLITGYRGSGKTSFVNKVVNTYQSDEEKTGLKVSPIKLNLAQSVLSEIDVLRLMVSYIHDEYFNSKPEKEKSEVKRIQSTKLRWLTIRAVLFTAIVGFLIFNIRNIENLFTVQVHGVSDIRYFDLIIKWMFFGVLIIFTGVIIHYVCFLRKMFKDTSVQKNEDAEVLRNLKKRCYSTLNFEESKSEEFSFQSIKILGGSKKQSENMPIATSKELEHELSNILKRLKREFKFVFIFDELDKIDPPALTTSYYQEIDFTKNEKWDNNYLENQRARKQAVINLIAGLKNFITTAEANFIFIAGREMFDASMADIADRQSSLGSVFNYVFNIDSFLKEKFESSSSLSKNIERYLCRMIFDQETEKRCKGDLFDSLIEHFNANISNKQNRDQSFKELSKVIVLLQNFIVYLTYRTNGSPKRLIRTIHEYIQIENTDQNSNQNNKKERTFTFNEDKNSKIKKFLYFGYHAQYRIGFINYLYRPFLIKYGRSFKQYSDNIITSTSYLFDHLLKFHPFGFNMSSLELIPEVLSTNKTPTTKEHLKRIIGYLMNNHVKVTEVGLFNYKFYNRTSNELSYLSKISETESAAFNFTLDESYLIKAHVRNKIKELRSIYAKFYQSAPERNSQIHSISFMNDILGDLHFFDQEYDDSIVAYSDAIKPLEDKPIYKFSYQDFVTLITSMLKIGLCYEKISSYEKALAWYSDASESSIKFILFKCGAIKYEKDDNAPVNKLLSTQYRFASIIELLQISNQAFLAMAIIEEKLSIENNSVSKFASSIGTYFQLIKNIPDKDVEDQTNIIKANTYLVAANVFYYRSTVGSVSGTNGVGRIEKFRNERFDNLLIAVQKSYEPRFANQHYRYPAFSLAMYFEGLIELFSSKSTIRDHADLEKVQSLIKAHDFSFVDNIVTMLDGNAFANLVENRFTKYHFKYLGIFLSCIGDCLLSSCKKVALEDEKIERKSLPSEIFESYTPPKNNHDIDLGFLKLISQSYYLHLVIKYYYLSGYYFSMGGRSLSAGFQLRKILLILKEDLADTRPLGEEETATFEKAEELTNILREYIITPLQYYTNKNAENTETHMYYKFKEKFEKAKDINHPDDKNSCKELYKLYFKNNLSNHPEVREIHLLFYYISIKIRRSTIKEGYDSIINPYNSIATQYARIMELEYFAFLSRIKFQNAEGDSSDQQKSKKIDAAADFISSLISALRILNFYGSDYMIGFSHQANIYYKIGSFFKLLNKEDKDNVKQQLKDVFGVEYYNSIYDTAYYYKLAKLNYQKAIQLHSTGAEYNKTLEETIYLEDDFSDNSYHYGAAFDRYLMVNNVFSGRIKKCEEFISRVNNEQEDETLR